MEPFNEQRADLERRRFVRNGAAYFYRGICETVTVYQSGPFYRVDVTRRDREPDSVIAPDAETAVRAAIRFAGGNPDC